MPQPLRLLPARAADARRYSKLRSRRDYDQGIETFKRDELAEFEQLNQKFLNREFVTEAMTEDKLARLTAQRIERMQNEVKAGRPPFQPELSYWEWDKKESRFRWTNQEVPEGAFGLTWKPEHVEGSNPLAQYLEGVRVPIQ